MKEIGFGGSCHWCTEAIFLSIRGVLEVEQGWISSSDPNSAFSEAVIVKYDEQKISLPTLIKIHLYTHSCTSEHTMRMKYRSAIYTLEDGQIAIAHAAISTLQQEFTAAIITTILPLVAFKPNNESYQNYYFKNPEKPFCENIVDPKLRMLLKEFSDLTDSDKLAHLAI